MAKFNKLLDAKFTPPKRWELQASLIFDSDIIHEEDYKVLKQVKARVTKAGKITAFKGFKTDLASVPRIAWSFIAPFDIARSAVIHDALYAAIREYREENGYHVGSGGKFESQESKETSAKAKAIADKIFLEAMMQSDPPVAKWKAYASYYSVVLFGRWSIIPRETD
tara:strand:+ start:560 stop:1060 length:501 start_codon:yes stop_codon:yes gene_type:complete